MATLYSTIIDIALVTIRDYKIDKLFNLSPTDFETYMTGFLIKAIPKFTNCVQDLTDRNDTTRQFNVTLTDVEIGILSDFLLLEWLDSEIYDIRQITGMLQNGKEAHRYSEANLLDKKILLRTTTRESLDVRQTAYSISNTDWTGWAGGDYGI